MEKHLKIKFITFNFILSNHFHNKNLFKWLGSLSGSRLRTDAPTLINLQVQSAVLYGK